MADGWDIDADYYTRDVSSDARTQNNNDITNLDWKIDLLRIEVQELKDLFQKNAFTQNLQDQERSIEKRNISKSRDVTTHIVDIEKDPSEMKEQDIKKKGKSLKTYIVELSNYVTEKNVETSNFLEETKLVKTGIQELVSAFDEFISHRDTQGCKECKSMHEDLEALKTQVREFYLKNESQIVNEIKTEIKDQLQSVFTNLNKSIEMHHQYVKEQLLDLHVRKTDEISTIIRQLKFFENEIKELKYDSNLSTFQDRDDLLCSWNPPYEEAEQLYERKSNISEDGSVYAQMDAQPNEKLQDVTPEDKHRDNIESNPKLAENKKDVETEIVNAIKSIDRIKKIQQNMTELCERINTSSSPSQYLVLKEIVLKNFWALRDVQVDHEEVIKERKDCAQLAQDILKVLDDKLKK